MAPENTLPAFEAALAAGAPVLECDVQLSRDGRVVLLHDSNLARTGGTPGDVAELPWASLTARDVAYASRFGERFGGVRPALLEQLLELARARAEVMVEIKPEAVGPAHGGIEEAVVRALRRGDMLEQAAVISRSAVALRRVAALAPGLPRGLVFRRLRRRHLVEETIEAGADWLIASVDALRARPATVTRARAAGLAVGCYVVADEQELAAMLALGVQSLATDDPAWLLSRLPERTRPASPAGASDG